MEKINKSKIVKLLPHEFVTFDVNQELESLLNSKGKNYYLEVTDDAVIVIKKYNNSVLNKIVFDTRLIKSKKSFCSKLDIIRTIYIQIYLKAGNISKRCYELINDMNKTNIVYKDKTKDYPEIKIIKSVLELNPEVLKDAEEKYLK